MAYRSPNLTTREYAAIQKNTPKTHTGAPAAGQGVYDWLRPAGQVAAAPSTAASRTAALQAASPVGTGTPATQFQSATTTAGSGSMDWLANYTNLPSGAQQAVEGYSTAWDEAFARNQERYEQGMAIWDQIANMYAPGGNYMQSQLTKLEQQKKKDVGAYQQQLTSSGLWNTTVAAGAPMAWEGNVGQAARESIADTATSRYSSALAGKAGFIESAYDNYPSEALLASLLQGASNQPSATTGGTSWQDSLGGGTAGGVSPAAPGGTAAAAGSKVTVGGKEYTVTPENPMPWLGTPAASEGGATRYDVGDGMIFQWPAGTQILPRTKHFQSTDFAAGDYFNSYIGTSGLSTSAYKEDLLAALNTLKDEVGQKNADSIITAYDKYVGLLKEAPAKYMNKGNDAYETYVENILEQLKKIRDRNPKIKWPSLPTPEPYSGGTTTLPNQGIAPTNTFA